MNNGYLAHSVSGGTNHLFGLAEGFAVEHQVSFVAPSLAADLLPEQTKHICYPSFIPRSVVETILVYLTRIVKASRRVRREPAEMVLTLSLLFDVIPAFVHRTVFKSSVGIFVFHLIPLRRGGSFSQKLQFFSSYVAQRMAFFFYRRADVIFPGNSQVKQQLIELGISEERMEMQYPAVNIDGVRQAASIPRYDVIFIGRMVARKGIYDLVDTVRDLGLRVGLIGEGEERLPLQAYIAERGLSSQFDVLGHLSIPEAYGLLKGSRCLAFPSYEEGYGIAIAEAILAGKPVITYELPHYREAFGDGPVYVPVGDKEKLRTAFQDLVAGRINECKIKGAYKSVIILDSAAAAKQVFIKMTDEIHRKGRE
ncbi:MAG: glycosyltransferase [Kiritimatiellales bacterium]|nr:glycosyltransferase [Kiritimatiellales bacterium]